MRTLSKIAYRTFCGLGWPADGLLDQDVEMYVKQKGFGMLALAIGCFRCTHSQFCTTANRQTGDWPSVGLTNGRSGQMRENIVEVCENV